jgi:hypothetical protein
MKTNTSSPVRRLAGVVAVLAGIALAAAPARAWTPETHVHLAELTRRDLVARGGQIAVEDTGFWDRTVRGLVGTFVARPDIHDALARYPAYFRAGVLGPDAYPDILFGQQVIHPEEHHAEGADVWLRRLWTVKNPASGPELAFAVGFLVHAAGDTFAHTLVNEYAGGPFTMSPLATAKDHLGGEGYLGTKVPPLADYSIETAAVDELIYQVFINAERSRSGNAANDVWRLTEGTWRKTLPGQFTHLREGLRDKLDGHRQKLDRLGRDIADAEARCGFNNPGACANALALRLVWLEYKAQYGMVIVYYDRWIEDIDAGLRAWPGVSTQVARALLLPPTRRADTGAAKAALEK